MSATEWQRGDYTISTDPGRLDVGLIHAYLDGASYWAQGRPLEVVQRSIEHSLCFGVYRGSDQAGFARVVTDYATFAWLCDVFVRPDYAGRGLGKWLIETVVAHPALGGLRNFLLATRDAHELYRRYGGFQELPEPHKWMIRRGEGGAGSRGAGSRGDEEQRSRGAGGDEGADG